jgi:hypothetical protein
MEHKSLAQLQALADVQPAEASVSMGREQRLSRWIDRLEADPERRLRALHEIEYLSPAQRRECRADDSPLSVAYADPVLRSAGLTGDRVGDCTDFFELNDDQVHHAFCSCHVGIRLSSRRAARRLRHMLRAESFRRKVSDGLSRGVQALFAKLGA